jgi:hypothetical protein
MAKTIRSLIGLSLLLAAVSASAQVRHTIQVTVPFPFVTAEKSWPAADYQVEITPENGILTLRSADITPATMLTTSDERSGDNKAHLRLQCSGDRWVLREVVVDGVARVLPLGKSEKEQAEVEPSCQDTIVAGGTAIQ